MPVLESSSGVVYSHVGVWIPSAHLEAPGNFEHRKRAASLASGLCRATIARTTAKAPRLLSSHCSVAPWSKETNEFPAVGAPVQERLPALSPGPRDDFSAWTSAFSAFSWCRLHACFLRTLFFTPSKGRRTVLRGDLPPVPGRLASRASLPLDRGKKKGR